MTDEDYQVGASIGFIAYGASARSARHALKVARSMGKSIDMLTLLTLWPFAETQVEALAARVDRIIVPEMNQGQIATEVERLVGRHKVTRVNRANGEMVTPQMILDALKEGSHG
jgi:2-oxoglutarate ferredoxin oxidoreductase subunit alpha